MTKFKKHIGIALAAVAMSTSFYSCNDDFDAPGMNVPVATMHANTTIADIKAKYWNDADNYIDTIKLVQGQEHKIISGRVISSDASGNIYKSLVIQDATGALALSINANSLYNEYRIGQEVVIDLTNMYIGKYSTLQQLGFPDFTPSYGWQATFMPLEFFKEHSQLNGLPNPALVDTLTINISDLGNGSADQMKYQSQLVRFNNVYFEDGGEKSFCDGHKVNTNRVLKDENGNEIIVRTSGYANYWSMKLPEEHGDVVGILSTYKQSGSLVWQLLMRSPSDLINFGDPTLPQGTETNPYDILSAIDMEKAGTTVNAWFTGYIVGSVKGGVTEVTSADDIAWTADGAEAKNTLVIGQTAESKSLDDCVVVRLAQDSPFREYGNLIDNPGNLGKQIWVLATPGKYLEMAALTGNNGTADEFRIEGVTVSAGGNAIASGDGTEANPYNPTQVVAKGLTADEANKWVSGYIVGWVDGSSQTYADETNCKFTVPATTATNVLIATTPDVTDYTQCAIVNLPNTNDIRAKVNLVDNPGNLGKILTVCGTVKKYYAMPGVRDLTAYKLEGSEGGGGDTPTPPAGAVSSLNETFEGGTTIPAGWANVQTQGNASWFIRTYNSNNSAEITAYGTGKTPGATGFESWLISPALDVNSMTDKTLSFKSMVGYTGNGTLTAYVLTTADPATATKTKLNATIPPATGSWSDWVESGNISLASFSGTIYIGFCYNAPTGASYTTYRVDDIVAGTAGSGGGEGGGDTPTPPATDASSADLNTLTNNSSYGTYTTASGWVATNCAVQSGGDKDSNPVFQFIGSSTDTKAVCLNGNSSKPGSLVSPTLAGGIKTLTFKYGFAFADAKCKFTVNIKQNGSVVKTKTVTLDTIEKFKVYDFSMDVNVTGDFVMEIVNDCYSAATTNKDRVSIWNITWTK